MEFFVEVISEDPKQLRSGWIRPNSWRLFPDDGRVWRAGRVSAFFPGLLPTETDGSRAKGTDWWRKLRNALSRTATSPPLPDRRGQAEELLSVVQHVREVLRGRIIDEGKVVQQLRRQGHWPAVVDAAVDYGTLYGYWRAASGVQKNGWFPSQCTRCGSHNLRVLPCPYCGRGSCQACMECENLGLIRECTRLLWLNDTRSYPQSARVRLEFPLTPAQAEASEFLVRFVHQRRESRALVWAACGAGKTETVFGAMAAMLQAGGRVLFAIPRRDVVVEMENRLRSAFPGTTLAILYGGRSESAHAPLVAATTHQVLRFYQAFDLVVLDEVDAFPYHGSEMLRFGMERAIKPGGKWIEMTATPVRWPVSEPSVTIPARFHGKPLPEPRIVPWTRNNQWNRDGFALPRPVHHALQKDQWLVFVPTKRLCQALKPWLERVLGGVWDYCHSQSPNRSEVVEMLRQGRVRGLVTTTVLERGITIPNIQVCVLWADHEVFSSRSLVQIAGRVGRKKPATAGHVLFAATKKTPSIQECSRQIAILNEEARTRGLLVDDHSNRSVDERRGDDYGSEDLD